jgi:peptidyl-prolyl cis-trans isomerase-like protein 2
MVSHHQMLMYNFVGAALVLCCAVQAAAGDPEDPDNLRSSWFSNPGAAATVAPVRSGVGKYIAGPALDAPVGSKAAAGAAVGSSAAAAAAAGSSAAAAGAATNGAAGAAEPAVKKQKVAAKGLSNFDAW